MMTQPGPAINSSSGEEENRISQIAEQFQTLSTESFRFFRSIWKYCVLISALLTLFTADLVPRYFADITISATGRRSQDQENGTVVGLSLPNYYDLIAGEFVIWKSSGWKLKHKVFISQTNQPADLRITGYYALNKKIEFARGPDCGEVLLSFHGKPVLRDLFADPGIEAIPLFDHLPKNLFFPVPTILNVLRTFIQNLLILVLFLFVVRPYFAELSLERFSRGAISWSGSPEKPRRVFLSALIFVMCINFLFLNSPLPPENLLKTGAFYVQNVLGIGHIVVNSDSWELMTTARTPPLLLTPEHRMYQDRPLYAAVGFLFSLPFRPFHSFFARSIGGLLPPFLPEFIGFILFNALLLSTALLLLQRLTNTPLRSVLAILLPLIVLSANEVTKIFFWTPHFQILNICVPIFSIAFYAWLLKNVNSFRFAHFLLLGSTFGICILLYGAFAITVAGTVLILVLYGKQWKGAMLVLLLAALPPLLWVQFVTAKLGYYHPGAVHEWREFVWLLDGLKNDGLNTTQLKLSHYLFVFWRSYKAAMIFPAIVLASCLLLRAVLRIKLTDEQLEWFKNLRLACMYHIIIALPFFALMGFYATRLTWSLVPTAIVLIAAELQILRQYLRGKFRNSFDALILIVSIIYLRYWVIRAGPWG